MWEQLKKEMEKGDVKSLARCISLVENEAAGFENFLESLVIPDVPVIGITGPPGAGKSTLTDALIGILVNQKKKVGVLCIDPSSPFNMGALLGDRIRMHNWYNNPDVFIRSLSTKASLGGLNPKTIEITDLLKISTFDYIIIETVGVGQSEIEIAALADVTVVVLVPESGDEIQSMKSGLMEIADIFVVNKSDRPNADQFVRNLKQMISPAFSRHSVEMPVIKTVASEKKGTEELMDAISQFLEVDRGNEKRSLLLAEKAYQLIQNKRMQDVSKLDLAKELSEVKNKENIFRFIKKYTQG